MPTKITVDIEGINQVLRKLRAEDPVYAEPWREALTEATELAYGKAMQRAPEATGRLKARMTKRVGGGVAPRYGVVSNRVQKKKARYAFILNASKIAHYRGGPNRGQPTRLWFTHALDEVQRKINDILTKAAERIERKWGL